MVIGKMTMDDIAKICGVSKATVSRVLSSPERVKKDTRERIQKIIDEYNFTPNTLAKGLAGVSTRTIGIVVDELYNDFFIEIVEGIDNIVEAEGYSLEICSSRWKEENEIRIINNMISKRLDGIILAPLDYDAESIKLLRKSGIPFMIINCLPSDGTVPYVAFDDYRGGEMVAEYINSRKEYEDCQIIMITGYAHQTITNRTNGFYNRIREPEKVIRYSNVNTFNAGLEFAEILVSRNNIDRIRTVLFITNDNVAVSIESELAKMKIDIPSQVSIIGFDDIKKASICRVPLSTISQSNKEIGILAAMDLLDMIKGKDSSSMQHIIQPKLVLRESSIH